ncbi:hypothetical protein HDV05_003047, partial [Chytridiales sp. JEL 0842]
PAARRHLLAHHPADNSAEFDVRVAIFITNIFHELLENFRFSFLIDRERSDAIRVFLFSDRDGLANGQLQHNSMLRKPPVIPDAEVPTYFMEQWPSDEVFLEHFRQAVLRNCRGSADQIDENESYEDELVVRETEYEMVDRILQKGGFSSTLAESGNLRDYDLFEELIRAGAEV